MRFTPFCGDVSDRESEADALNVLLSSKEEGSVRLAAQSTPVKVRLGL